ncbi:nuclear transport factor 2 family protein [Antribacter sp. KLBMP9083]|uniref:Nuclear transport factor 2 family protein n=1 Tax=Antribacter soli TaxID=2910976 RepID=A0AA41QF83_9MICO|nr:nuclear transport factor 2 family protein [Antribacter soli]MCF4121715.1 nuclear transport factor 2 family protein [Antribacter soli]
MSSNDNIALIQRLYAANGDPEVISAVMSPDVTWDITPTMPGGAVYTGLANVVSDFLVPLNQGFESFVARPEHLYADGDRVLAVGHYVGTAKTGEDFQARFVHIWTIAGDKIVHNYQVGESATVTQYFQG